MSSKIHTPLDLQFSGCARSPTGVPELYFSWLSDGKCTYSVSKCLTSHSSQPPYRFNHVDIQPAHEDGNSSLAFISSTASDLLVRTRSRMHAIALVKNAGIAEMPRPSSILVDAVMPFLPLLSEVLKSPLRLLASLAITSSDCPKELPSVATESSSLVLISCR